MNKSLAILLVVAVFAFLSMDGGVASAQSPDGVAPNRVQQQRAPAACPPNMEWGCVLSGSTSPGLSLNSTSTANNSYSLYASLNNPGSGSAAVWGRVLGTGSTGYGVYGSHQGSGYGVYGFSNNGIGFLGYSNTGTGMQGETNGTGAQAGILGLHRATSGTGAGVEGRTNSTNASAAGVSGLSPSGYGVYGQGNRGVYGFSETGEAGVYGLTNNAAGSGVYGLASGSGAAGVYGRNSTGPGVWGRSTSGGTGVYGVSTGTGGRGVYGFTDTGDAGVYGLTYNATGSGVFGLAGGGGAAGVYGRNSTGPGVQGYSTIDGPGVQGDSTDGNGVYGSTETGDAGVYGESLNFDNYNGSGVYGNSRNGRGVYGFSSNGEAGVYGASGNVNGSGVYGRAAGSNAAGVYGQNTHGVGVWGTTYSMGGVGAIAVRGDAPAESEGFAGYFFGRLGSSRTVYAASGATQLDHPLDPANMTLSHAFVESPEMMSVYNGNVVLDARGEATVELPTYFQALNRDFRYVLTPIGGFAPLYIAQEIENNRFRIGGGTAGLKVSWQVSGIRNDAWAQQNRLQVEELKPEADRGRYLHPEAFGQPESRAVERNQSPTLSAMPGDLDATSDAPQRMQETQDAAPPAPTEVPGQ